MKKAVLLLLVCGALGAVGGEVELVPAPDGVYGEWAQAFVPLRLRPTPVQDVRYGGPPLLLAQWGEIVLGTAHYPFLLGVRDGERVELWVDADRNLRVVPGEAITGTRGEGYISWTTDLTAYPAGGAPYPYGVTVLWPEGRGYVYLLGGPPRHGELVVDGTRVRLVLVDGDLNGVFGTKGDFHAVDVDGDVLLHGDPDGHERFALGEPFTVGERSFRLERVAPDGGRVTVVPTEYVPPKPALLPGHPAPELAFLSFLDQEPVSLGGLRGKVVLINFWATWCGPCMAELPHLLDLYAAHRDQGFEIVGISLDTSETSLETVLLTAGPRWPVAFAGQSWDNPLAKLYRVYQIPTSYLLDREGVIRYRDLHGEDLERRVKELLATSPAAPPPAAALPTLPTVGPPRGILDLAVPGDVGLTPGEANSFRVRMVNTSPYLAEEVLVSVTGLPAGASAPPVEVGEVPAFGEREAEVVLQVATAAPPFTATIEVLYYYCIGDSCFQIQEQAAVAFGREESRRPLTIPAWWALIALGVGVILALSLRGRALFVVALVLIGLAGVSLAVGILRGQATQAWRIGSVLCTSCVGIEEPRSEVPALSPREREALGAFPRAAHLVVFYTLWCKSCPYAKALVAEMARANPRITYELVDAEQERLRAEEGGVIHSGRVVVPAILVGETGQVLFGTGNLAARILAALEEIR